MAHGLVPKTPAGVTPIVIGKGQPVGPGITQGVQPEVIGKSAGLGISNRVESIKVGKSLSPAQGTNVGVRPIMSNMMSEGPRIDTTLNVQNPVVVAPGIIPPAMPGKDPSSPASYRAILKSVPEGSRSGIAIVGRFEPWPWGQHPEEIHLADALELQGLKIYRVDQYTESLPVMEAELAIFTADHLSWGRMGEWSRTHRTILWAREWLPDYIERRSVIEAARAATFFVTTDRFDWGKRFGLQNHVYLPGSCDPLEPPFDPRPRRKCAFIGSIYNARRYDIAKIVERLGGDVLDRPGSWLYGLDLAKFVQDTKVIVGDNATNSIPGFWSSRNYIIPGAGGFLLTPYVPGLEKNFEIGEHLSAYRSVDVLKDAVEACASNDDEREMIRKAGFLHVRQKHNWTVRAKTLVERIRVKSKV